MTKKTLLVTGGCGFIGSAFIRLFHDKYHIINIDTTHENTTGGLEHTFEDVDIGDRAQISRIINSYSIDMVVNFAAELTDPSKFVPTNIVKLQDLLQVCRSHYKALSYGRKGAFRFLQVSTDEVYGSVDHESTSDPHYMPNSLYSASKAAGDHLVRSFWKTYDFPVLTTHGSNSYGPYQSHKKLIPLMVFNAIEGRELPLHGDGLQERDWLHVDDHCRAIDIVLNRGSIGGTYNIGSGQRSNNRAIVLAICEHLGVSPDTIRHIEDRPGHYKRYAINSYETEELGWKPEGTIAEMLPKTIDWYVENKNIMTENV